MDMLRSEGERHSLAAYYRFYGEVVVPLSAALTPPGQAGIIRFLRMKLRLPLNRAIGPGLVVLAVGLVREAAEQLSCMATGPVESIHAARVALKRARSTLRLLEKAGAAWAFMPRHRLAELGSRMSAAREHAVTAGLARSHSRKLRGREREVVAMLAARPGRLLPPQRALIRPALLAEARNLGAVPAPALTSVQMRGLIRQCLDRTDRRFLFAMQHPTLEAVHAWRKALIVLRDQTAMAAGRWPQGAGVAHPPLVRLARQLGRRGDLALLVRRLQRLRVPPELAAARQRLIRRLVKERELATLAAMLRWLRLENRLTRLLAEKTGPAGRREP